jgi:hypothetical protein
MGTVVCRPLDEIETVKVCPLASHHQRDFFNRCRWAVCLARSVMTGRRRSYLEHWASIHGISVDEAAEKFPRDAGIARYGEPQEIAELMAFLVSPRARWMTGSMLRMDGGEVKSI